VGDKCFSPLVPASAALSGQKLPPRSVENVVRQISPAPLVGRERPGVPPGGAGETSCVPFCHRRPASRPRPFPPYGPCRLFPYLQTRPKRWGQMPVTILYPTLKKSPPHAVHYRPRSQLGGRSARSLATALGGSPLPPSFRPRRHPGRWSWPALLFDPAPTPPGLVKRESSPNPLGSPRPTSAYPSLALP